MYFVYLDTSLAWDELVVQRVNPNFVNLKCVSVLVVSTHDCPYENGGFAGVKIWLKLVSMTYP